MLSQTSHHNDVGQRFREALYRANGTIYLSSWAHIIELFALGQGPTFDLISQYLESFGSRFVIIDSDASSVVVEREKLWSIGKQNPAVDEDFLRLIAANWDTKTAISFSILLKLMSKEERFFTNIKKLHSENKVKLKALFDDHRNLYRHDRAAKKTLNQAQYSRNPPNAITNQIQLELARESVRTHEEFNPSDGIDFFHAVVALSYCTFVVLDKKWARRCRKLALPKESASVFDGTEIEDVIMAVNSFKPFQKNT